MDAAELGSVVDRCSSLGQVPEACIYICLLILAPLPRSSPRTFSGPAQILETNHDDQPYSASLIVGHGGKGNMGYLGRSAIIKSVYLLIETDYRST